MPKPPRAFVLTAVCLLAGCATAQRYAAADDVHGFLVAVRDNDRGAFEAHVDRVALEAQMQYLLVKETRAAHASPAMTGVGLLASGPAARIAGSALLRPEVFRAIAEYYGYRPDAPLPSRLAIAGALRSAPDGRICASLKAHDRCLLTFADEQGTWRLVGFAEDRVMRPLAGP